MSGWSKDYPGNQQSTDPNLFRNADPSSNNGQSDAVPAMEGYWTRYMSGATFLLDQEPDPTPVWGQGPEVLWSPGEPCLVTGPIGSGKTTLLGHLTRGRLGLERQVLGYPLATGARRVLYLACDRPRQIARNLGRMMHDVDRAVLADRLVVWRGPPPTDLAKTTSMLLDMCHKADADTVVVDGLKDVAPKLSDEDVGAGLNQAFQRCVTEGIEVIGNHHQRKTSNGVSVKPKSLSDMYGSTWIAAGSGTVILVWADQPGQAVVELSTLKPARENVGPLSVLHDLDTGHLEVRDAIALEDVLRSTSEYLSITDLLGQLGNPAPDRNDREALRRKLARLVTVGAIDTLDVPSPTGGRPEKLYGWNGP